MGEKLEVAYTYFTATMCIIIALLGAQKGTIGGMEIVILMGIAAALTGERDLLPYILGRDIDEDSS